MRYRSLALFSLLLVIPFLSFAEPPIMVLWKSDLRTFLESAPSAADVDLDGDDEVIVAGREEIICVEGNGDVAWRVAGKGRFMTYPTVLTSSEKALIYAADCAGWLHCWDKDGKVIWEKELAGPAEWSAAAVSFNPKNNSPAIIQADTRGTVWAFHAYSGDMLWKTTVEGAAVSPCVVDLLNNNESQIVLSTSEGKLFCLDASGKILWKRNIGGPSPTWATGAPIAFTTLTRGTLIAAPAAEGSVSCFSSAGDLLWTRQVRGPLASGLSAGDIDEDGVTDVFAITQLGVIYRYTETGRPIWEIDMQGRTLAAGAILDVDGDNKQDFVLSTQQGMLLALDQNGHIFHQWQAPSRTINCTPTFGQLLPKTETLEFVLTGGEAGVLYCFGTRAKPPYRPFWTAYRANAEKTGAWLESQTRGKPMMCPVNVEWDKINVGEPIRFEINVTENHKEPYTATITLEHPNSLRQSAFAKIVGKSGELQMPLIASAPGLYRVSWRLESAEGKTLLEDTQELTLEPLANDLAFVKKSIQQAQEAITAIASTMPLSASALSDLMIVMKARLETLTELKTLWHEPGQNRDALIETVAQINAMARHLCQTAQAIRSAYETGNDNGMIITRGALWESRGIDHLVPLRGDSVRNIRQRVVRDEHEPIVFNLFNMTDRELAVRVTTHSGENGPTVKVYRAAPVPTARGYVAWDALPDLDSSRIIAVPSLETRQVWLDVEFSGISGGQREVETLFEVLNGPGVLDPPHHAQSVPPDKHIVKLTFDVLPFEMASSESLRLCTWANPDADTVEDLLRHGNNVFVLALPAYVKQVGANPSDPQLDTAKLDEPLARLAHRKVFLLLSGIPDLSVPFGSEEYLNELKCYIPLLVAFLESLDFDVNHFALYPCDEPGGHGWDAVERVAVFGEMVKKIRPDLLVYVNGGGETPMFERLAPVTDIWCPSLYQLPEDSGGMRIMRTHGKALWSYNCAYGFARPVGANIKDINVIAEFRTAALFALRYGASGIGYWCYNVGEDMWQRVRDEYPLVYPAEKGIVTSRRWEAVREGIEDYRVMVALREQAVDPNSGMTAETRERVRQLLEGELAEWMDKGFQEMRLGVPRYAIDLTYNEAAVQRFRERILDCVTACAQP